MPVRSTEAVWEGTLREGSGTIKSESGHIDAPYTWKARFEEGDETNPEELLGAAHAACFAMQVAANLQRAGFDPQRMKATANVHMEKVDGAQTITKIVLDLEGEAPDVSEDEFLEAATAAKENCIISRALAAVETEMNAKLV
ncbi:MULTISPECIES: OsmC family peroxiredoxin [unclassified Haladaptatus]|uniref:OsmC family peroxiredoxin n=1 Tax=unclassified Haladaptatus TaxID=2622732 RepID=UPI0023E7BC89|nr:MULTISPECIES: OsmC family peroxiredoxin [unclassified Haladaptatus]